MDLNFDTETNNLTVDLDAVDIMKILAHAEVSEITRRGIGHITVAVTSYERQAFDKSQPIGDQSYVDLLKSRRPILRANSKIVDIKVPTILIAANQSDTEHFPQRDIKLLPGEEPFNGTVTVTFPSLEATPFPNIDSNS